MTTKSKPVKPAEADAVLVSVLALHPIRHDGVDHASEAVFELPLADAQALVVAGWAELARLDPPELSLA